MNAGFIYSYDISDHPNVVSVSNENRRDFTPSTMLSMHYKSTGKELVLVFPNGDSATYDLAKGTLTKSYFNTSADFLGSFFDQSTGTISKILREKRNHESSVHLYYETEQRYFDIRLRDGVFLMMNIDDEGSKIAVCSQSQINDEYGISIYDKETDFREMYALTPIIKAPLAMAFHPIKPFLYFIDKDGSLNIHNFHTEKTISQDISKLINFYPETRILNFFFYDGGNKIAVVTEDEDGFYSIHQLEKSLPSLDLLYLIDPSSITPDGGKK